MGFEHGLAPASYKGRFKALSPLVMVAPSGQFDSRALKEPLENHMYYKCVQKQFITDYYKTDDNH